MRTVKEVSRLTGVSVRTLHHYDAIGLLRPAQVTEAGYRLYDDAALRRLQSILLFRELQFPLKEIAAILDSPGFDPMEALERQIHLLEMQRDRLGRVIDLARALQKKGVTAMAFDAFDQSEIDQYKAEAKARWGETRAYREFEQRGDSALTQQQKGEQLMDLLAKLGVMRDQAPGDEQVQAKVDAYRQFISDHFYTCDAAGLRALGEMYVADERFLRNIDRRAGDGSAAFISKAIAIYCDSNT